MIVHDVVQGSREWYALRLGIPTVSQFPRFITKAKLQYAAGAKGLVAELVAEKILGRPCDWGAGDSTIWTDRGTDMEDEAWRWYEAYTDADTRAVGFVTTDQGGVGGSPDRLVLGPDGEPVGGVEIKCRSAKNHMECVLSATPATAEPLQVQGYLWLTGLPWWDVVAFNPDLPKRIDRVYPDGETFKAIEACLDRLAQDIAAAEKRLEAVHGVVRYDERSGHDSLVDQLYASVEGP